MKRILSVLLTLALLCAPALAAEDWYLETAKELAARMGALARDDAYLDMYGTSDPEVRTALEPLRKADFGAAQNHLSIDLPVDAFLKLYGALSGADALSDAGIERLRAAAPSMLVSAINGMQGTAQIAAASIVNFSRSAVMPEDFSPCVVLLEADGATAAVSFAQTGADTITATAAPLFPGDGVTLSEAAAQFLGLLSGELD